MKGQRGSALVTVVGLSIVLTLAAGGLLSTAAISQGEEDMTWERTRCFHDLESGLMLGTNWLKNAPNWTAFTDFNFDLDVVVPADSHNGCAVTVSVINTSADTKTIEARHVDGGNSMGLSWKVTTDNTSLPRNVFASDWQKIAGGGP